ncbi:MAG: DUF5110 domain-containing protein [Acholeplasmataceae bacterium]|nr:DUF5110 domain-containing protein [Acholeplasmataceae bacterium]
MYGKLLNYQRNGEGLILFFEKKKGYLRFIDEGIVNICDHPRLPSFAVKDLRLKEVEINITSKPNLTIQTKTLKIIIGDDFRVDFYTPEGEEICLDYPIITNEKKIQIRKKMYQDQCFFGLGDKTGFLNKRGYEYEMWNSDDPNTHTEQYRSLYKSIPFLLSFHHKQSFGIFFDNTYRTYFDLGKQSDEYFEFGADEGHLNYYFLYGKDLSEVVKQYTYLSGRFPLPQIWTLGNHQSRWSYASEEEAREIVSKYKEHRIPLSVLHLDIDYMDAYKVFTISKARFPNFSEMISDFWKEGVRVVLILDPGVKVEAGYGVYEEGIKNSYFAFDKNKAVYQNKVWPGLSVFPAFTSSRVRRWWADKVQKLADMGISGIWDDMNEPASFEGPLPDDVVFPGDDGNYLHKEVHNVYGHLMAEATYEGLRESELRPFVITRACFSGTQKYATVWTGDNQSIWPHLQMSIPQLCNLGLSGIPFAGTDIGGFGGDTTKELLIRWVQAAVFVPLFRNHSAIGTRHQEPWAFDKETLSIYRKYVELRYRFIPYLYDLFYEHLFSGSPIMRPLVYHYQDDSETWNLQDEYMVGSSLLISPVVNQGVTKKLVYLPEGDWIDYRTKEEHFGKQYLIYDAPLEVLPIFVKKNSIIVLNEKEGDFRSSTLRIEIYGEEAEYHHYVDDGASFAYQHGDYQEYIFSYHNSELTIQAANDTWQYQEFLICHNGKEIKVQAFDKTIKVRI